MRVILLLLVFGYVVYCGFGSLMDSQLNPSAPYHTLIAAVCFFALCGYAVYRAVTSSLSRERWLAVPVSIAGILLTLLWLGSKKQLHLTSFLTALLVWLLWISVIVTAGMLCSYWLQRQPGDENHTPSSPSHHVIERLNALFQRLIS